MDIINSGVEFKLHSNINNTSNFSMDTSHNCCFENSFSFLTEFLRKFFASH